MKSLSTQIICLILLSWIQILNGETTLMVNTPQGLMNAYDNAQDGDTIQIASGHYKDWKVTFTTTKQEEKHVIIIPEIPQQTIFSGQTQFTISTKNLSLRGFIFRKCEDIIFTIVNADHCRLSENTFEYSKAWRIIQLDKENSHIRIDHNIFQHNESVHIEISPSEEGVFSQFTVIDHNVFSDVPKKENGNGREIIKIGRRPYSFGDRSAHSLVEYNTFIRCNGEPEIISNKCSRNIFRYNNFSDCDGELVLRGGRYCAVIGNHFSRCSGGIRITGTNHLILENYIEGSTGTQAYDDVPNKGTGIRLKYGSGDQNPTFYLAVKDCIIANNTIVDAKHAAIQIGAFKDRDLIKTSKRSNSATKKTWDAERYGPATSLKIPPQDNLIVNNLLLAKEGHIFEVIEANDNIISHNVFQVEDDALLGIDPHKQYETKDIKRISTWKNWAKDICLKNGLPPFKSAKIEDSHYAGAGGFAPEELEELPFSWIEMSAKNFL